MHHQIRNGITLQRLVLIPRIKRFPKTPQILIIRILLRGVDMPRHLPKIPLILWEQCMVKKRAQQAILGVNKTTKVQLRQIKPILYQGNSSRSLIESYKKLPWYTIKINLMNLERTWMIRIIRIPKLEQEDNKPKMLLLEKKNKI
jgi:hypothetical protein